MAESVAAPRVSADADALQAIEAMIVSCAHALDDDELDRWPEFFVENGVYRIISRENYEAGMTLSVMYCEGKGMMRDRIRALRTANIYEPHTYCHLVGRTEAFSDGDGVYRARTNFSVIRTMQDGRDYRFATGKFLDDVEIVDGQALLRERTVVLESRRIDTLLAVPL